jgi:DNA-directed RNA polymerase specialized sigma subunit
MTNKEKIAYLSQYSNLLKELKESQLRYRELRSIMTSIPAQKIDDMPKAQGEFDKIIQNLIKLEALSDTRTDILDKLEAIEKIIDNISDPRNRRLMKLRYLDGKKWHDIYLDLDLSKTHVNTLHGLILTSLEVLK